MPYLNKLAITLSGYGSGGGVIFPSLTIPPAEEQAIMDDAAFVAWWRPDVNFGSTWTDRIGGVQLSLAAGTLPTLVTGGKDGRPYLKTTAAAAGCAFITPAGNTLWPIGGDYTLAFVAQQGDSATEGTVTGAIFGNALAADNASLEFSNSGGLVRLYHRSTQTQIVGTAAGAFANAAGAQLCVASYDAAAKTAAIRRNYAQLIAPVAVTVENTNARLVVGAAGVNGSAAVKPLRAGSLYEAFVLNVPVHRAAAAASLARLEAYVKARYPTLGS